MNENEFKFLGNTIENISIKYGIFLVMWSALVSWISGSESLTSWIPAMIGFPIFIFGWLTRLKPSQKKLFMHCAVTFGLLAFIGGLSYDSVAPEGWVLLGLSSLEITTLVGCFLFIKTGLVSMVLQFLNARFSSKYTTAITDRVLNMVLIRYGYKEGLLTGNLKTMQDEFIRVANYHEIRKKITFNYFTIDSCFFNNKPSYG